MNGIDLVYDCIHANVSSLPKGASYAGYATGSPEIAWTEDDHRMFPDAVMIDQTLVGGAWDATADIDDYENGAVKLDELGPRAKLRMASFRSATRPGQRTPAIYASANNITTVVNALIKSGVDSGVGLWVAHWNVSEPLAIAAVVSASGPFPVIGFQFTSERDFDISVFSTTWLANRSRPAPPIIVPALIGVVSFLPEGMVAKRGEMESRPVTSADNGNTWK